MHFLEYQFQYKYGSHDLRIPNAFHVQEDVFWMLLEVCFEMGGETGYLIVKNNMVAPPSLHITQLINHIPC